ncbi:MAG: hypothetical protein PVF54_03245 [Anaerolineae bacterium]|jgi:hypothetical protein
MAFVAVQSRVFKQPAADEQRTLLGERLNPLVELIVGSGGLTGEKAYRAEG